MAKSCESPSISAWKGLHLQLLSSEMMIVTNSMCLQASLSVTRLRLLECLLMQKYPPLQSISHATRPNHCWITAGYQFCIPINCDHRCHCHCHHCPCSSWPPALLPCVLTSNWLITGWRNGWSGRGYFRQNWPFVSQKKSKSGYRYVGSNFWTIF